MTKIVSFFKEKNFFSNLKNGFWAVLANSWIAYFSIRYYKGDYIGPDVFAIITGFILLAVLTLDDFGFGNVKKGNIIISGNNCHRISCTVLTFLSFFLFVVGAFLNKYLYVFYFLASIAFTFAVILFDNKFFCSVFKQLFLYFLCPIIAFIAIIYLVCKFPSLVSNNTIDVEAFKSFVIAFCNGMVNLLYVASFVLVLFISAVWVDVLNLRNIPKLKFKNNNQKKAS